jgi:hypothetical protein
MSDDNGRYYGKYRGSVFSNIDPENRGRIQVYVPDVFGTTPTSYALPCLPVTGNGSGAYFVPEVNAGVWVEFEQGDPDYPIWTGGFWGSISEIPTTGKASLPIAPNIVLQTPAKNSLTIFGQENPGVLISAGEVGSNPSISVTPNGIVVKCGTSTISVTKNSVDILADQITLNGTALVVSKG